LIRVALKGLAGRKFRASLTAVAIVLGVAMISGTYVLTDTIDKAFNAIFTESYAGTDAVISGRSPDITFQGDTATAPPVPACSHAYAACPTSRPRQARSSTTRTRRSCRRAARSSRRRARRRSVSASTQLSCASTR
jgi:hypothetical protein